MGVEELIVIKLGIVGKEVKSVDKRNARILLGDLRELSSHVEELSDSVQILPIGAPDRSDGEYLGIRIIACECAEELVASFLKYFLMNAACPVVSAVSHGNKVGRKVVLCFAKACKELLACNTLVYSFCARKNRT